MPRTVSVSLVSVAWVTWSSRALLCSGGGHLSEHLNRFFPSLMVVMKPGCETFLGCWWLFFWKKHVKDSPKAERMGCGVHRKAASAISLSCPAGVLGAADTAPVSPPVPPHPAHLAFPKQSFLWHRTAPLSPVPVGRKRHLLRMEASKGRCRLLGGCTWAGC